MSTYSNGRKIAAMVGVTLILTTASGGTSVMNAIIPFLLQGMNVTLTVFMIGPTIATILAFVMSAVGTKIINIITPKWCMLIGTICGCVTMTIVGLADSVAWWIVANILNGVVLAFATYAAAGGVVAEFYGENTQKAFGIVAGATALCVAAWMAATSALLNVMSYQTLFIGYSVAILIIGVICNFILIGKLPKLVPAPARAKKIEADDASEPVEVPAKAPSREAANGVTFGEALKSGASIYCFLIAMAIVWFVYCD